MSEQQVETPVETPAETLLSMPETPTPETSTEGSEWMLTPEIKGLGDKPEYMKEKFKSVEDQAKAYTALESKLGSFTGAPDEYVMNVPEGMEGGFEDDDPLVADARVMAKEIGMNQEGFDRMVALYLGHTVETPESMEQARVAEVSEVLGENAQARISQVSGALSNMLDAETYKEIAPFVNTPQAIRLVEAIVLASAPRQAPIEGGQNPEGLSMAKLNEMRGVRVQSGPHANKFRWHVDADYRKQIEAYSKALHGET